MSVEIVRSDWKPAIRPLAKGQFVAAVGDVHGRADLLTAIQDAIADEMSKASPRAATVILLGDLIDRGPQNRMTLRAARRGIPGAANVILRGNHEDRLLALLSSTDDGPLSEWLRYGGDSLFAELKVDPHGDWRTAFRTAMGPDLIATIAATSISHQIGDLLFVHAGIDPTRALAEQSAHDMMWIRESWLASDGPYDGGVAVIHGHTPVKTADLDHPHRINIDQGAYATGILSALVIREDRMRLMQAHGPS